MKDRLAMTHIFNEVESDKTFIGVSRSGALLNQLLEYIVWQICESRVSSAKWHECQIP